MSKTLRKISVEFVLYFFLAKNSREIELNYFFPSFPLNSPAEKNIVTSSLNLSWCGLGSQSASFRASLCPALASNATLISLDLSDNGLTGGGHGACAAVTSLSRAMAENASLVSLELGWNPLEEEGGRALLENIGRNSSLMRVGLEGTGISQEARKEIGELAILCLIYRISRKFAVNSGC